MPTNANFWTYPPPFAQQSCFVSLQSVCLSWAWSVTKDRRERDENTWIDQQRRILRKHEHEQGQYCILPTLSKNLQLYNEEGVKGVACLSLIQNFRPETVWSALSDWILHKKAVRTSHLKELAAHIQWPLMGADFRSQQVDFEFWNSSQFSHPQAPTCQVIKSSLYQHLDIDWTAEVLLLFGGDHRDSRQVWWDR